MRVFRPERSSPSAACSILTRCVPSSGRSPGMLSPPGRSRSRTRTTGAAGPSTPSRHWSGCAVLMHCDGARIWNAHVATGTPLWRFGELADTLSVCLSKGLGAPVGSLVVCDANRADEARELRHRLGGGWRQAGILAAAGLYALEHHVARLADDHARARRLATTLAEAVPDICDP